MGGKTNQDYIKKAVCEGLMRPKKLAYDISGNEVSYNSRRAVYRASGELMCEMLRIQMLPLDSPELRPLREMLDELDRGLPIATSGEVLLSRVAW